MKRWLSPNSRRSSRRNRCIWTWWRIMQFNLHKLQTRRLLKLQSSHQIRSLQGSSLCQRISKTWKAMPIQHCSKMLFWMVQITIQIWCFKINSQPTIELPSKCPTIDSKLFREPKRKIKKLLKRPCLPPRKQFKLSQRRTWPSNKWSSNFQIRSLTKRLNRCSSKARLSSKKLRKCQ